MDTTIDRIYKVVEYKNDSIYKLSKEIGVSNGYFSKQRQSNGAISSNIIEKIVNHYPDVDANWLLSGNGNILKSDVPVAVRLPENSVGGVPLIPIEAMAGFGKGEIQVMEYECERYVVPLFKGADFLIQVKGSSMIPKYNSGDVVACKKLPLSDIFFQWNKVYVLDTDQGALVKRIKEGSKKEHLLIISDNPQYDSFELHLSKVYSVALVIGVIRLE